MNYIKKRIIKWILGGYYKAKQKDMVQYWKRGDHARAKIINNKDGALKMVIEGEKYAYPGFPRGHVLTGSLAKLKHKIKNAVFNDVFKVMEECLPDMIPPERMMPAVKEMWDTFEKLEDMEVVPDMKARIALIKKVICFFLQEDDAYRFRAQIFLDLVNRKKTKMTKEDLYYARGKYWKADRYKKILGEVYDAYEY